jgi:hypothetical protein
MSLILNPQNYEVPRIEGATLLVSGLSASSQPVLLADTQRRRVVFGNPNDGSGDVPRNIYVCQADDARGNALPAHVNGAGMFTIFAGASLTFEGNVAKSAWNACMSGAPGVLSIVIDPPDAFSIAPTPPLSGVMITEGGVDMLTESFSEHMVVE